MKRYPAQIRYEKKHPTVSFRLNKELKERLKKALEGKSFADFVKEGLGVREREKKSLEEEYEKGYRAGYNRAKSVYSVYGVCWICGEKMIIEGEEEKKKIKEYLKDSRYCHRECAEKEERKRKEERY